MNCMTIKQVTTEGAELFWQAQDICAQPLDHEGVRRLTFSKGHEELRCSIDAGTAYIMNAAGKTIDVIALGKVAGIVSAVE